MIFWNFLCICSEEAANCPIWNREKSNYLTVLKELLELLTTQPVEGFKIRLNFIEAELEVPLDGLATQTWSK